MELICHSYNANFISVSDDFEVQIQHPPFEIGRSVVEAIPSINRRKEARKNYIKSHLIIPTSRKFQQYSLFSKKVRHLA